MRSPLGRAVTVAASLVAAISGCGERDPLPEPPQVKLAAGGIVFPQDSPQLASITVEPVRPGGATVLRLGGRLVWDEDRTVRLYPAFAGRVARILAKPGDAVKPGQTLALLASPDYGQAQAEARKAEGDIALAQKTLVRVRELVAHGVAPGKDLATAEADYARAEAEVERTRALLKLYGGREAIDQSFALKTPIAGVVVERNINPGQELRPDLQLANSPAMFVITDPSRLWVVLDATERDLRFLKSGGKVTLRVGAFPGEHFVATIETISDFLDPQTRTEKVRGSIPNSDRRLKGEMFVTAELETEERAALEVPAKAVFLAGDKYYVFVEEGPGASRASR
ncbi:MAG: efflux RND transporter periplasmic adaptor subunit [Burkholderiales bacterium]|nr:efflux RND transporter periplasmic adaptor subunit [Burkholderiales bacterium]